MSDSGDCESYRTGGRERCRTVEIVRVIGQEVVRDVG